ncbi:MAG: glycosyltransferase [Acidimicrobiales bacterium]|jgi:UDP:flavonoid glycosyltransferase YjiC (YdhE family)
MASIMWACWDGGGNLTPSLGIARELAERGHGVHFFGRPDMLGRVEAAGFPGTALAEARTDLDRYAFHPLAEVFGYTSSPSVGEELVGMASAFDPDVVVIDAMFSSALDVAPRFRRPTAVMLHTLFDSLWTMWQANFAMQSESRVKAGFSGLPPLDVLWGDRDLLQVNALEEFDGTPATAWDHVVHGAPVLAVESRAVPVDLPWGSDGPTPLVLLSFSTVAEQRSPEMLQRALDALEALPVHVVATTGAIVDPAELAIPANAHVVPFADHDRLMDAASFVVGHGGHGTTMRALRHGLPIVGIPAKGGDQAPITEMLDGWGVGIALSGDASVEQIRSAAARILSEPTFSDEARGRSRALEDRDGAVLAADSVEALVRRTASH